MANNESINKEVRPFGMRDKVGYLFGDMGNDFFFMLSIFFLMVYFTNVLGISGAVVGTLFFAARIWDGVVDVLWGRFIDSQSVTDKGKFRPWIIRCSPLMAITGALMFIKIPGMSDNFNLIYGIGLYVIWGSFYSTVNIPYGSLASVMTTDQSARSALSSYRTVGAMIATKGVGVAIPLFAFINNKPDAGRFAIVAIVCAACTIICHYLCYKLTTERVVYKSKGKVQMNISDTMKGFAKNKPLIIIIAASFVLLGLTSTIGALNAYLFMEYFHDTSMLSVFFMLGFGVMAIVVPTVEPLSRKFGKRDLAAGGMLLAGIVYLGLYLVPVSNVYWYLAISFVGEVGRSYLFYTIWAFVADVIDYQEYITGGKREEGTVYAFYAFTRKLGQAVAGGLGGYAIHFVGYVPKATEQAPEVAQNLYNFYTLLTAGGYLVIFLILVFLYPLTKAKLEQLTKELEERRAC